MPLLHCLGVAFLDDVLRVISAVGIDIANGEHLDVLLAEVEIQVVVTHRAHADEPQREPVAGGLFRFVGVCREQRPDGGGGDSALKEGAARERGTGWTHGSSRLLTTGIDCHNGVVTQCMGKNPFAP